MTVNDSRPTRSAWAILLVLSGAIFLEGVDVSMMGVALPAIRADMDMSTGALQWVVSAYVLGYGGFVLLGGRAADLLGRRRMFLLWLGVFVVFSGVGGLATEGWMLIVARFATGVAAGFLAPAGLSIITTTFDEGPARNKALLVYAGAAAAGFSFGLVAGGLLSRDRTGAGSFPVLLALGRWPAARRQCDLTAVRAQRAAIAAAGELGTQEVALGVRAERRDERDVGGRGAPHRAALIVGACIGERPGRARWRSSRGRVSASTRCSHRRDAAGSALATSTLPRARLGLANASSPRADGRRSPRERLLRRELAALRGRRSPPLNASSYASSPRAATRRSRRERLPSAGSRSR